MRRISLALLVVASLVAPLTGCTIYRMDIAQGNIVTQEMVDQLRVGMSRNQVRFVLGTPLIADSFHPDRWDYYYSLRSGLDKKTTSQTVTVVFKDDTLAAIEGGVTAKPDTGRRMAVDPYGAPPPGGNMPATPRPRPDDI